MRVTSTFETLVCTLFNTISPLSLPHCYNFDESQGGGSGIDKAPFGKQEDGVAPAAEGGDVADDAELGMDLNKSKKKKKKKVPPPPPPQ